MNNITKEFDAIEHVQSEEYIANELIGWYDGELNAAMWFSHGDVQPKIAACLLCQINPDNDKVDPLFSSNDETNPGAYKSLLSTFEDEARCNPDIRRTLEGWRDIAIARNLKFHSWVVDYLKAKKISNLINEVATSEAIRGETKKVIQRVFEDLHFNYDQWGRNLADPPHWLRPCLVSKGSKGRKISHLWNPVLIGLALMDKAITKKQLNLAFMDLKDWKEEWQEKMDLMD